MIRKLQCASLITFAFVMGCGVKGSGNVVTQSRDVSGFTAVEFGDDGRLILEQSGTESLTITADDNLMPYLTSEVRNGRLLLNNRDGMTLSPTEQVVFRLSVKNLDRIDLSSDGSVIASAVRADRLRINVNGDGEVKIAGNVDRQEVRVSSDGSYDGQSLASKTGTIDISGDGKAILAVADKLDVNISGDGSVEYIGNPTVTQHVSGDGWIRKR